MDALLLLLVVVGSILPASVYAQGPCVAPALSDQQVKAIVDKERAKRTDLQAPFAEMTWSVQRQGCHYVYIEFAVPAAPDSTHTFTLNQHGVIVDTRPGTMKCPDKVLTEAELADIVKKERARRKDLPPPFPRATTHVVRVRCLYLYSSTPSPKPTASTRCSPSITPVS